MDKRQDFQNFKNCLKIWFGEVFQALFANKALSLPPHECFKLGLSGLHQLVDIKNMVKNWTIHRCLDTWRRSLHTSVRYAGAEMARPTYMVKALEWRPNSGHFYFCKINDSLSNFSHLFLDLLLDWKNQIYWWCISLFQAYSRSKKGLFQILKEIFKIWNDSINWKVWISWFKTSDFF